VRTEVRTVTKLEFKPIPEEMTELCLVPTPPLDSKGELLYTALVPYTAEVLGILEVCNDKLALIRQLDREGDED
jgi:hypothetical protein